METAHVSDVLIYSLIGGLISLAGGVLLLSRKRSAEKLAKYATPFSAGALIAAVFLDLLLDGIEETKATTVFWGTMVGIILFFFMERVFDWFHHHHEHPQIKKNNGRNLSLIIVGNGLHNLLDGVAIAASFLINVPTGIVTTIAVAAHEIPHEIGDFGLMLARGMSRRNVLIVNALIAGGTVLVAVGVFLMGKDGSLPIGFLLGISAGFLLYIAMSDIIPSIHEHMEKRRTIFDWQSLLLLLGVGVVALAIHFAHKIENQSLLPSYLCGQSLDEYGLPDTACIDE